MERVDILVIGAGAAGIAAAKAAAEAGCERVLLMDRRKEKGGVLLQCLHHGFGRNLNGPEFTEELLVDFPDGILWYPETTVLSVTKEKTAILCSPEFGKKAVSFQQLILATGCREIPLGTLPIGGSRPMGVYTAGQMQAMMNLHGFVPEGPAVILGSGDIGLVMARHLAEHGISVTMIEQREQCGGMPKNQTCLREYPIQLCCNTTIREICGQNKLESVILSDGRVLPCKTLLIAAGLRPEQELILEVKDFDWLQLCGNCNTVYPVVEAVVSEGEQAGMTAYEMIRGSL